MLIALLSSTWTKNYKEEYFVTIQGEVRKPEKYPYFENQTVKDLIFAAGGFTDGSSVDRIEIASRIDLNKYDSKSNEIAQVININSEKELDLKGKDIKLKPWDIVTIRTKPGYKSQVRVRIEGEVLYPGYYVLASKDEKVSSLLSRSGGLTHLAFLKGVSISRINKTNILKDIYLQEDDVINVPKQKREIKVSGEVLFPTEVVFVAGQSLSYYVDKAGGFTDDAQKRRVYVLKANGVAAKTKHFLFFKSYPKVEEGSEILVPKVSIKKKASTAETVAVTTGIAALAGVVVAILNLLKK